MNSITTILYDIQDNEVEAEIFFSIDDPSFDHEFGTQKLPLEILVEEVRIDGKDVSDEELAERYEITRKKLMKVVEKELDRWS